MHDAFAVQVGDCFAHVSEILPNFFFGQTVVESCIFYFLEQSAPICVLEHHIGDFSLLVDEIADELYYFGEVQFVMHFDLVLGDFVYLTLYYFIRF